MSFDQFSDMMKEHVEQHGLNKALYLYVDMSIYECYGLYLVKTVYVN